MHGSETSLEENMKLDLEVTLHQLTQELMRDNLQIELEALKVSPLESIKVGLE